MTTSKVKRRSKSICLKPAVSVQLGISPGNSYGSRYNSRGGPGAQLKPWRR
jgi:hypothetical protein